MMESTPNTTGGGCLFDLSEGPDFPASTTLPEDSSSGDHALGQQAAGLGSLRSNGSEVHEDRGARAARLTAVPPEVATESVKRFFRALLDGSPASKNAKTVRAASEWPRMLVDDFFDRMVSPASYVSVNTSSMSSVPSIQPSDETAGSGRVTMRDVFGGFIWS